MKEILGVVSLAIALVSYSIYITHTIKGSTKPHAVTWLIWALLNGFVFFEQLSVEAGPGAWVTAAASAANFAIFFLALVKGERSITKLDWTCFALTLVLLFSWASINNPTISVFLAVVIFMIGFIPTLRKSMRNAHEETVVTYALNGLKFFIALTALTTISVASVLYPLVIGTVNLAFALYLLVARRHQKKHTRKGRHGTKSTRRR